MPGMQLELSGHVLWLKDKRGAWADICVMHANFKVILLFTKYVIM